MAGFFAFSPIVKATTVHSTIISTQQAFQIQTDSGTGITDGDTVVIDCNEDFIVEEIYFTLTDFDSQAAEQLELGDNTDGDPVGVEIDGIEINNTRGDYSSNSDRIMFRAGGTANNEAATTTWSIIHAKMMVDDAGTGDFPDLPRVLVAEGDGNNDIVLNLFDGGGNAIDATDQLTVKAVIWTESNANCSVSVNT